MVVAKQGRISSIKSSCAARGRSQVSQSWLARQLYQLLACFLWQNGTTCFFSRRQMTHNDHELRICFKGLGYRKMYRKSSLFRLFWGPFPKHVPVTKPVDCCPQNAGQDFIDWVHLRTEKISADQGNGQPPNVPVPGADNRGMRETSHCHPG